MSVQLRPPVPEMEIRRLDLEEYHRLIEMGFFASDERVELIEGVLHSMSPKGPRHAAILSHLLRVFITTLGERAEVRAQDPITIPPSNSEPEPDLTLASPREGGYLDRHPLPQEVLLVVEIADLSLAEDGGVKLRVYAAAGIEDYWIINLVDDQVEVHRGPVEVAHDRVVYRQRTLHMAGDTISPLHFPDCSVDVASLLRPS